MRMKIPSIFWIVAWTTVTTMPLLTTSSAAAAAVDDGVGTTADGVVGVVPVVEKKDEKLASTTIPTTPASTTTAAPPAFFLQEDGSADATAFAAYEDYHKDEEEDGKQPTESSVINHNSYNRPPPTPTTISTTTSTSTSTYDRIDDDNHDPIGTIVSSSSSSYAVVVSAEKEDGHLRGSGSAVRTAAAAAATTTTTVITTPPTSSTFAPPPTAPIGTSVVVASEKPNDSVIAASAAAFDTNYDSGDDYLEEDEDSLHQNIASSFASKLIGFYDAVAHYSYSTMISRNDGGDDAKDDGYDDTSTSTTTAPPLEVFDESMTQTYSSSFPYLKQLSRPLGYGDSTTTATIEEDDQDLISNRRSLQGFSGAVVRPGIVHGRPVGSVGGIVHGKPVSIGKPGIVHGRPVGSVGGIVHGKPVSTGPIVSIGLRKTVSGYTCQRWNTNSPHKQDYHRLGNNNLCTKEGHNTLWCYTTDRKVRWEECKPEGSMSKNKLLDLAVTLKSVELTAQSKTAANTVSVQCKVKPQGDYNFGPARMKFQSAGTKKYLNQGKRIKLRPDKEVSFECTITETLLNGSTKKFKTETKKWTLGGNDLRTLQSEGGLTVQVPISKYENGQTAHNKYIVRFHLIEASFRDPLTRFIVVQNEGVVLDTANLAGAKAKLKTLGGSRLIAEYKNCKLGKDPHKIDGVSQTKANGFNKSWKDWNDINRMIRSAQTYINKYIQMQCNPPTRFIVVRNGSVVLDTVDIAHAKAKLKTLGGSRLIAEYKNCKLAKDPHRIDGVSQTKANGFNNSWNDWNDINRMIRAAQTYINNGNKMQCPLELFGLPTPKKPYTKVGAGKKCKEHARGQLAHGLNEPLKKNPGLTDSVKFCADYCKQYQFFSDFAQKRGSKVNTGCYCYNSCELEGDSRWNTYKNKGVSKPGPVITAAPKPDDKTIETIGEARSSAIILEHVVTKLRVYVPSPPVKKGVKQRAVGVETALEARRHPEELHLYQDGPHKCRKGDCYIIRNLDSSRAILASDGRQSFVGKADDDGKTSDKWYVRDAQCTGTQKCYTLQNAGSNQTLFVSEGKLVSDVLEGNVTTLATKRKELMWKMSPANSLNCGANNSFHSETFGKSYCMDPLFTGDYESAVRACKDAGGSDEAWEIVSILSKRENDFIASKLTWPVQNATKSAPLYERAGWIGLVEWHDKAGDGLSWVTGEDAVFKNTLKSHTKSAGTTNDCFTLTQGGEWKPEKCVPGLRPAEYAPVVCQRRTISEVSATALQEDFYMAFPKGLVYLRNYDTGFFVSFSGGELLSHHGKPKTIDRFKVIRDASGVGMVIQASKMRKTKNQTVPVFEEGKNFIALGEESKDSQSMFEAMPTLGDRSKAMVFTLTSAAGGKAPYGFRSKYDPNLFFSVNALGYAGFTKSTNPAVRQSWDFVGAPDKYQLVITLDEIDYAKHINSDEGEQQSAIAAQRTVTAEIDGTITIELSSEESDQRSITKREDSTRDFSKNVRKATTETNGGSRSASIEVGGSSPFFSASATGTLEDNWSSNYESSVDTNQGWSKSSGSDEGTVQTRTVRITDTVAVVAKKGMKYTASLVVVSNRVKNMMVNATARLYADGVLVASKHAPMQLDTTAVSKGSIVLTNITGGSSGTTSPAASKRRTSAPTPGGIGTDDDDDDSWKKNLPGDIDGDGSNVGDSYVGGDTSDAKGSDDLVTVDQIDGLLSDIDSGLADLDNVNDSNDGSIWSISTDDSNALKDNSNELDTVETSKDDDEFKSLFGTSGDSANSEDHDDSLKDLLGDLDGLETSKDDDKFKSLFGASGDSEDTEDHDDSLKDLLGDLDGLETSKDGNEFKSLFGTSEDISDRLGDSDEDSGDDAKKVALGKCPPMREGMCTRDFRPVRCGENKCEYSNDCEAKLAGFSPTRDCVRDGSLGDSFDDGDSLDDSLDQKCKKMQTDYIRRCSKRLTKKCRKMDEHMKRLCGGSSESDSVDKSAKNSEDLLNELLGGGISSGEGTGKDIDKFKNLLGDLNEDSGDTRGNYPDDDVLNGADGGKSTSGETTKEFKDVLDQYKDVLDDFKDLLPGEGPPEDQSEHCAEWAASGECHRSYNFMFENCATSCHCAEWAANGECQRNPKFMLDECATFCDEKLEFNKILRPLPSSDSDGAPDSNDFPADNNELKDLLRSIEGKNRNLLRDVDLDDAIKNLLGGPEVDAGTENIEDELKVLLGDVNDNGIDETMMDDFESQDLDGDMIGTLLEVPTKEHLGDDDRYAEASPNDDEALLDGANSGSSSGGEIENEFKEILSDYKDLLGDFQDLLSSGDSETSKDDYPLDSSEDGAEFSVEDSADLKNLLGGGNGGKSARKESSEDDVNLQDLLGKIKEESGDRETIKDNDMFNNLLDGVNGGKYSSQQTSEDDLIQEDAADLKDLLGAVHSRKDTSKDSSEDELEFNVEDSVDLKDLLGSVAIGKSTSKETSEDDLNLQELLGSNDEDRDRMAGLRLDGNGSPTTTTSIPLDETDGPLTESGIINGRQCSDVRVVSQVVGTHCNPGSPDFDREGMVCANYGQTDEAYCSYNIGPGACAYCGDAVITQGRAQEPVNAQEQTSKDVVDSNLGDLAVDLKDLLGGVLDENDPSQGSSEDGFIFNVEDSFDQKDVLGRVDIGRPVSKESLEDDDLRGSIEENNGDRETAMDDDDVFGEKPTQEPTDCPLMGTGMCTQEVMPVLCGGNMCKYGNGCKAELAGFDSTMECVREGSHDHKCKTMQANFNANCSERPTFKKCRKVKEYLKRNCGRSSDKEDIAQEMKDILGTINEDAEEALSLLDDINWNKRNLLDFDGEDDPRKGESESTPAPAQTASDASIAASISAQDTPENDFTEEEHSVRLLTGQTGPGGRKGRHTPGNGNSAVDGGNGIDRTNSIGSNDSTQTNRAERERLKNELEAKVMDLQNERNGRKRQELAREINELNVRVLETKINDLKTLLSEDKNADEGDKISPERRKQMKSKLAKVQFAKCKLKSGRNSRKCTKFFEKMKNLMEKQGGGDDSAEEDDAKDDDAEDSSSKTIDISSTVEDLKEVKAVLEDDKETLEIGLAGISFSVLEAVRTRQKKMDNAQKLVKKLDQLLKVRDDFSPEQKKLVKLFQRQEARKWKKEDKKAQEDIAKLEMTKTLSEVTVKVLKARAEDKAKTIRHLDDLREKEPSLRGNLEKLGQASQQLDRLALRSEASYEEEKANIPDYDLEQIERFELRYHALQLEIQKRGAKVEKAEKEFKADLQRLLNDLEQVEVDEQAEPWVQVAVKKAQVELVQRRRENLADSHQGNIYNYGEHKKHYEKEELMLLLWSSKEKELNLQIRRLEREQKVLNKKEDMLNKLLQDGGSMVGGDFKALGPRVKHKVLEELKAVTAEKKSHRSIGCKRGSGSGGGGRRLGVTVGSKSSMCLDQFRTENTPGDMSSPTSDDG